ncbi:MAG: conjugal transfer protein TraI [Mucilaginibacter sp.]|uniref:conjugal transfer protein TraI n=1 Tax=Mucilaginibacter sp. TaxID=1882438 RepID=UPI00326455A4
MKFYKIVLPVSMVVVLITLPEQKANAQFVIGEVLNQTVGKIIRAIDLSVQRAQNQTIWLQNAQKVIETQLNQLNLSEIAGVGQQQTDLFSKYYNELFEVKTLISDYEQVKNITLRQEMLVKEYQSAWALTQEDENFSAAELQHISAVYSGILDESVKNLDQLMVVINSFKTQMTDGQRMEIIDHISKKIDGNYNDLKRFNNENILLSLGRSRSSQETQSIKNLYGIH